MKKFKKDLLIKVTQACINSYQGKHGKEDDTIYKNVKTYEKKYKSHLVEYDIAEINKDVAMIIFRGSYGKCDWRDNFRFKKIVIPFINDKKIKGHEGFVKQYEVVRTDIHEHLISGRLKKYRELVICGHSLGGALANQCSLDLKLYFKDIHISCITLGAPRVGNPAFVKLCKKHLPGAIRIVNGADMVTKVPPTIMGFKHFGILLTVGARSIFWKIIHPKLAVSGNPFDHYPERYMKHTKEIKVS